MIMINLCVYLGFDGIVPHVDNTIVDCSVMRLFQVYFSCLAFTADCRGINSTIVIGKSSPPRILNTVIFLLVKERDVLW